MIILSSAIEGILVSLTQDSCKQKSLQLRRLIAVKFLTHLEPYNDENTIAKVTIPMPTYSISSNFK